MYNSQYYTCEQIDERLLQGYLDDYNTQTGQSLTKAQFLTKLGSIFSKEGVIDNTATQIGYYECDTAAGTAAKAITVANYALFAGGSMKVKFANKNTANNATLNINSQGAKALYYQGERASATNSWDAEEVVEIYYDGTSYYANNVKGGSGSGVYDVSKEHPTSGPNSDGKFTLEYILNPSNVNELIPVNKRYPGMTIQFVSTSDNKYVQYRLMSDTFSTTESDWQGVDDEPTAGSDNLVKSGGAFGENLTYSKYDKLSDYKPIRGHIGISNKNIIDFQNAYHICIKVNSGNILKFVKGSNSNQRIAFVSDYDFCHSLPYTLSLTSSDAIYDIVGDVEYTVPANAKYLLMEYAYDGSSALPSELILNGNYDLMSSIPSNIFSNINAVNLKVDAVNLKVETLFEKIEKTSSVQILSQATFDNDNPEIYTFQYGNIRYIPVKSGEIYRILLKRTEAVGRLYCGFTTVLPELGVEVSNIKGGQLLALDEVFFNIEQDGYLLYYAVPNLEYEHVYQLVSKVEKLDKTIFRETDEVSKVQVLSNTAFDNDNPDIYSFIYGDIRYIPVTNGDVYRIYLKRTDSAGPGRLYIGFTTVKPALGATVSDIKGGSLVELNEKIDITNDGYLLYYAVHPNSGDLIEEHIYKYSSMIEELDSRVNELEENKVPSYWESTLNEKINTINQNGAITGVSGDSFVFITDIHYPLNNYKSPALIKEIVNKTSVRKIFVGGDLNSVDSAAPNEVALAYLRDFRNDYNFTDKLFVTRGNHDIMNSISDGQFYSIFNTEIDGNIDTKKKNYYYLDNISQKIRYLIIDAPEANYGQSQVEISQEQGEWIENSISSLESGWSVIAFMHSYWIYGSDNPESIATSAISHINNGLAVANGVNMIAVVVGHCHTDKSLQNTTYGYWIISTTCDSTMGGGRPAGTTTEQAFDVYNIDTNQKKLMLTRIGYGNNREYTYGV